MTSYRLLATDLLTGTIREEVPFESLRFGHTRNGAGEMQFTTPQRLPSQVARLNRYESTYSDVYGQTIEGPSKISRSILDPGRTLMLLERDGEIVGNGILWGANPGGGKISFTGATLWSYFHRRFISATRTYTAVEQTTIAADLVGWAQGNGSLSYGSSVGDSLGDLLIDTNAVGTGKTRDRTYFWYEYKNLGDAVRELSAVRDGFDFDVLTTWNSSRTVVDRTFTTWYPRRGRRTSLVLELGTNIEDYSLQVDAGSQAIKVHGIGKGEGPELLATSQVDAGLLGVYPLLEDIVTHKDVSVPATLEDHAAARLTARRLPVTRPSMLNVRLGSQLRVGSWVTGDEVRLKMADGWVDVDSFYRIESWSLAVDKNGKETADMVLVETEAS